MFKKLSVKITVYVLIMLIIIIGILGVVYISNCKQIFIREETLTMKKAYNGLKKYSFKNNKNAIDKYLEKYSEQKYTVVIYAKENNILYSSKEIRFLDSEYRNFAEGIGKGEEYSVEPRYIADSQSEDLYLIDKFIKNGREYKVCMRESVKSVDAALNYANNYLIYLFIGFIIVCGILIYVLVRIFTKPISELSDNAQKIATGDYSNRYVGKVRQDEVGTLCENFNSMVDTLQDDINKINNYNFLLKEDAKRLNEYDSMRRRVLSNVTHELKTPLAIISSQIEMMNCITDKEKKEYYYKSAMEEIENMSNLISRLLNFSSGEKDIFTEKEKVVDLDKVIHRLAVKSRDYIKSKNVKYKTDIVYSGKVKINANHVQHIFHNYVMNALKHVSEGGTIQIGLHRSGNGVIRFSVYNDGEHIKKENLNNIWIDYYKQKNGDSDKENSVGLGLFIVKEISIIDKCECGVENKEQGVEFYYNFVEKEV